ncbi:MAG TPA: hypothetical protein VGW37_15410, partial [Terriglobia bacterium]|nr:hypothetical protein [Terriglobia bacterium]
MRDLANLALGFLCGMAVGFVLSSFFFGARIRFYKEYIEHRLASINRLHFPSRAAHGKPRASFWKGFLHRPSK